MLGVLLHAPRGLFYSPRQLGAVGDAIGRQFLPSVEWGTGPSGAPPVMNSTCPVPDLLPFLAQPTVGSLVPLAHRIVRCDQPTVGTATCRPLIAQTTIGRKNSPVQSGQSGEL
jgi:hypothetical protein